MQDLVDLILEKKFEECNCLFKEYMEAIKEAKMHEAKKALAAKMGCNTLGENSKFPLTPEGQQSRRTAILQKIVDQKARLAVKRDWVDYQHHKEFMNAATKKSPQRDHHAKKRDALNAQQKELDKRGKVLAGRSEVVKGVMRKSTYMTGKTNPIDDPLAGRRKSLTEGLRHVKTYEQGNKTAKVYRDTEWDEYRVKHFVDGKHQPKADYHTNDKEDAHGTAQEWLKS